MTKGFKTLDDIGDVRGKRVLVREDLNVPMADGAVTDDTCLRAKLPTVTELADKGAIVRVLAHFGRTKNEPDPEQPQTRVSRPYSQVLGRPVSYIRGEGVQGEQAPPGKPTKRRVEKGGGRSC